MEGCSVSPVDALRSGYYLSIDGLASVVNNGLRCRGASVAGVGA